MRWRACISVARYGAGILLCASACRGPEPGADRHDAPEPGADRHDAPEPGADRHDAPEPGADRHDAPGPEPAGAEALAPAPGGEASSTTTSCSCATMHDCDDCIVLGYKAPTTLRCSTQSGADCAAWSTFIALNWPADTAGERGTPDKSAPPSAFGQPGTDGSFPTVVWTTYMDTSEVFRKGAKAPPPWSDPPPAPDCSLPTSTARALRTHGPHAVSSSFRRKQAFQPGDALQADQQWLADQQGHLVWYEVLINETLYDYVTDASHPLYVPANQWQSSTRGGPGVNPPKGAMELKAAWRRITDPALYGRYLMVDACIPKAGGGSEAVTLGLVGLHIVYKLDTQPNWLWSTFEHVDNAPTLVHGKPTKPPPPAGWSFFDPECQPFDIPASCVKPGSPTTVQCTGSAPAMPLYGLDPYFAGKAPDCGPYRNQIWRQTPIPSCTAPSSDCNPSVQVTKHAHDEITAANPSSVFQYYELVSALWWTTQTPNHMQGGAATPLSTQGLQIVPNGAGPLANTTLESYAQDTGCLDCHAGAPVSIAGTTGCSSTSPQGCTAAPEGPKCSTSLCATGYSFIFDDAQAPAAE